MTPLSSYLATRPVSVPAKVGYDRPDIQYSLGGNDKFGDCAFCSPANHVDLVKAAGGNPQQVMEAEIERFYAIETGWTPTDPSTDKGAILANVLQDFTDNGWPTDPEYKPLGLYSVKASQISTAVHLFGACEGWIMLPSDGDGGYDFTDAAFGRPGQFAHAILIVGADESGYDLITWARRQRISRAWWTAFGRDAYSLHLPDWKTP
jgi:hypothetical protein